MRPILEIHQLSKRYLINHQHNGYFSLRERMARPFNFRADAVEEFWALQDVSFDVMPGESLGIIGRNGAGKSTLLKILSKITPPTTGKIVARGRVASLLEVGTGFHPELTGRENIFFNGSLLGMKKSEIQSKFDQIVDFSGVEKFLDTPLKHYSSGMQLRLAFAVAAFLEPEILVVDEVLAVGDAEFQRKCLGKMEDVSNSGRTVIFVSHQLNAVRSLCNRGIYLNAGKLELIDSIETVVNNYLSQTVPLTNTDDLNKSLNTSKQGGDFRLIDIVVSQDQKHTTYNLSNGKELQIVATYECLSRFTDLRLFIDVSDQFGTLILRTFHDETQRMMFEPGTYQSKLTIPADFFAPLAYDFRFQFGIHNVRMLEPTEGVMLRLNFQQDGNYNKAYHGQYTSGLISPSFPWLIERI